MKSKILPTLLLLFVLAFAAPLTRAGAGTQTPKPGTNAPAAAPLKAPVTNVLDHYIKIQTVLAADSFDGVSTNAAAIAKIITADPLKTLPPEVARQAETLAAAKNLDAARAAFKPLSESLIQYLAGHDPKSNSYDEVYCPMQEASWLQTSEEVKNPYLGNSMPGCGIRKRTF